MTRMRVLLVCVTAILGLLVYVCGRPEVAAGHGIPHPDFSAMKQGGPASRHVDLLWIGWLYGVAQIIFFGVCLSFGFRRERVWSLVDICLSAVTLLYIATFSGLVFFYGRGLHHLPRVLWLGMTGPSLLLVFGMWGVPLLYVSLYVLKFSSWIYGSPQATRFEEIKALYGERERGG